MIADLKIMIGDVRAMLKALPSESVQCVVTSPPYWGLRCYGTPPQIWGGLLECKHEWGEEGTRHRGGPAGETSARVGRDTTPGDDTADVSTGQWCQLCSAWRGDLGLEPTPDLFVEHLVDGVFSEVWRVLKRGGTLWMNMGDCYANDTKWGGSTGGKHVAALHGNTGIGRTKKTSGLKAKDLVGQPWRVAFALQAAGWWLRQDIIWAKPNPMPESIGDRCTKAHEYMFLLSKAARYYFDAEAIAEPSTGGAHERARKDRAHADQKCAPGELINGIRPRVPGVNPKAMAMPGGWAVGAGSHTAIDHNKGPRTKQNDSFAAAVTEVVDTRNKRSVWTIPTERFPEAHYATFPSALVRPCILAGSRPGDTVLDIFGGSGTTGMVALEYGRNAILIDLDPRNERYMRDRCAPFLGQGILPMHEPTE